MDGGEREEGDGVPFVDSGELVFLFVVPLAAFFEVVLVVEAAG